VTGVKHVQVSFTVEQWKFTEQVKEVMSDFGVIWNIVLKWLVKRLAIASDIKQRTEGS
jgi:hypothetical protein